VKGHATTALVAERATEQGTCRGAVSASLGGETRKGISFSFPQIVVRKPREGRGRASGAQDRAVIVRVVKNGRKSRFIYLRQKHSCRGDGEKRRSGKR